jgi:hypothetical protein
MDEGSSITSMTEQDRQISGIVAEERSRLRNFIRRRVPDPADVIFALANRRAHCAGGDPDFGRRCCAITAAGATIQTQQLMCNYKKSYSG